CFCARSSSSRGLPASARLWRQRCCPFWPSDIFTCCRSIRSRLRRGTCPGLRCSGSQRCSLRRSAQRKGAPRPYSAAHGISCRTRSRISRRSTINCCSRMPNAKRPNRRPARLERELQATIDMIPAMVVRYRHDGSYDFVNRTWQDYTGLSHESVRGGPRARIIHPEDLPLLEDAWRVHLATGEPFEMEHRVRRADGQYRWHWTRRVALRDDSGDVL